jgi:hypothetical protein
VTLDEQCIDRAVESGPYRTLTGKRRCLHDLDQPLNASRSWPSQRLTVKEGALTRRLLTQDLFEVSAQKREARVNARAPQQCLWLEEGPQATAVLS